MITLTIEGNPIPQARPRLQKNGYVYNPNAKDIELAKWQLKSQYREEQIASSVALDIIFFMPIPSSTSGIKKRQMINGIIRPSKKPDIDNLIKFTLDAMNNLIYKDDSQIVQINARKVYSSRPATLIRLETQTNQSTNYEIY